MSSNFVNNSNFAERPLYSEPLRGLRAWKVLDGRLRSVAFPYDWTPGTNTATCLKSMSTLGQKYLLGVAQGAVLPTGVYLTPAPEPADHEVGQLSCDCGFWAFFNGDNDYGPGSKWAQSTYDRTPYISGIVEGWGTCTVGTKGFRASKAAIRCLITENTTDIDPRVFDNYQVPVYNTIAAALTDWPYLLPAPVEVADE